MKMQRRVVLAGLAIAIGGPAMAQNRLPGETASGNAPEMRFIRDTMAIGSLSLAVSRISVQKATFAKLKEFARFEVAEQETAADVLKSLLNPGQPNRAVKVPSDAELIQTLDQQGRETVEKMHAAAPGAGFDRDYLEAQIDAHHRLLLVQDNYLGSANEAAAINVAKLIRGLVNEHIELLADIRGEMAGSGTTGAGPTRR